MFLPEYSCSITFCFSGGKCGRRTYSLVSTAFQTSFGFLPSLNVEVLLGNSADVDISVARIKSY
jgi:hypothetical protein